MDNNNIHNLLRRIQELEDGHAHLKQKMLNLAVSRRWNQTTLAAATSSLRLCLLRRHFGVKKLTEAQYFNILQSIDEPIHITDAKGCVIYRNRAWEKFYGYSAAETLGKDVIELLVEAKDAEVCKLIVQQILKGDSWSGEFLLKNKKGEKFLAFGVSKPFRDENGAVIGIIGVSGSPRPFQEISDEPSVRAPTRIDPHQPLQSDLAIEINKGDNCVYREKVKNGDDHKDEILGGKLSSMCQAEGKSVTCFSDYDKHSIRKIISAKAECMVKNGIAWPWKGNEWKGSCSNPRTGRFCWHWLHNDQEHEFVLQMNSVIPAKKESRPWVNANRTLGLLSSSLYRVDEIQWEDLQIRERIGRGSRGTVYHAVWCGSEVALKFFSRNEYSHDLILSFKQEVYLMKKLRHPNIILFMGAVTSPQHLCIVTEFLRRGSLFQLLHRNTVRLKWRHRVHMAIDIARGMNYLHHCRPPIFHCDLKSTNLLVDKNWTVKIGDFGMCRLKHETYVTTKEGIGAPEWMAPEVLCYEEANEKSDVYSFGVILWELATEKIPWDGLNSMQVMKAVGFMNQRLDIPKDVDPQWPSLIERCLHSIPESRPTFQDILAELRDLQKQFAVRVEASTPPLHESTAKRVCKYDA